MLLRCKLFQNGCQRSFEFEFLPFEIERRRSKIEFVEFEVELELMELGQYRSIFAIFLDK